jgi:hypothetical protein
MYGATMAIAAIIGATALMISGDASPEAAFEVELLEGLDPPVVAAALGVTVADALEMS